MCFRSPKRRRSRSSSRSRRSRRRRSHSRSREQRLRSRSCSQDRNEREQDRERRQRGLPTIKIKTLSGKFYDRNKSLNVIYEPCGTRNYCKYYFVMSRHQSNHIERSHFDCTCHNCNSLNCGSCVSTENYNTQLS